MPYFCNVLEEKLIIFNDSQVEKKEILEDITKRMCAYHKLDYDLIRKKILLREEAHSTGIGAGIAIPHCRLPDLDRIYGAVLISRTPIEFQALDEKPVNLIFIFISPLKSAQEHLKFLHFITTFSKKELFEKTQNVQTPNEFLDIWNEVCRKEGKI